uniref:Putative membrane glycoprotein lig-1 n=2 Tax=Anopheles marajoara TaxID=58244 RepID=A0A2M4BH46_9DIPT
MESFRAIIVSLCLVSRFYGGFGQYESRSWSNQGGTQIGGFFGSGTESAADRPVDKYSRISCKVNVINYDCVFENVHIDVSEVVSLARFGDYGQSYVSGYKSLAFFGSTIRRLSREWLDTYPYTTLLNLQDVQLRTIDRDAFTSSGQLQELHLSYNGLEELPQGVFDSLRVLGAVLLNSNRLKRLPAGLFSYNRNLYSVLITNNVLTRIEDSTFTYNLYLESVNVSSNSIEHFDLSLLKAGFEIDVSHNRLTEVKLPSRLAILFASNNHIARIILNGGNRGLKVLHLSNNKLTTIDWAAMYPGLEELDLGHNEIENVRNEYLPARNLKKLLLNNNRLFSFDLSKVPFNQLQVLDLSYNQLTYVDSNTKIFDKLHQLYLHNNEIVTLKLSAKKALQNISLSHNDWDCANLRTLLPGIEPSAILDKDEASCKRGYIKEGTLCCKEAKMAYLDRLLGQIRQKSVFELAKRIQCDDYQHTVVDIDKLNEALATAPVQSPDALRDEVNALTSSVTSLTAEKNSNEQLLTTVRQNLLFNMERYGVEHVGFDTPRMMADKLIPKLDSRNSLRKNQTISQWEATNQKNVEREELKSNAAQLETILSNKKATTTKLKQDAAKLNQDIKKLQAKLNANAASSRIYA